MHGKFRATLTRKTNVKVGLDYQRKGIPVDVTFEFYGGDELRYGEIDEKYGCPPSINISHVINRKTGLPEYCTDDEFEAFENHAIEIIEKAVSELKLSREGM